MQHQGVSRVLRLCLCLSLCLCFCWLCPTIPIPPVFGSGSCSAGSVLPASSTVSVPCRFQFPFPVRFPAFLFRDSVPPFFLSSSEVAANIEDSQTLQHHEQFLNNSEQFMNDRAIDSPCHYLHSMFPPPSFPTSLCPSPSLHLLFLSSPKTAFVTEENRS